MKTLIQEKWSGYGLVYLGINETDLEKVESERLEYVVKTLKSFEPEKLQPVVKPKQI